VTLNSPVQQHIGLVTLLVDDYDVAIAWYTEKLGFQLARIDTGKRWVVVGPEGAAGCRLLLAMAVGDEQKRAVGAQAGGRVFLFLYTDDFHRDRAALRRRGVVFTEAPRQEPYGVVAVFEDLYGNRWDLIELVQ
jgi:catechol 2,3-dioxygenase-like lactoylglutathione lyase family enzyme